MTDTIFDSEEHLIFRDSFKKFVAKEITPNVAEWEKRAGRSTEPMVQDGGTRFFVSVASGGIWRSGIGVRLLRHH